MFAILAYLLVDEHAFVNMLENGFPIGILQVLVHLIYEMGEEFESILLLADVDGHSPKLETLPEAFGGIIL